MRTQQEVNELALYEQAEVRAAMQHARAWVRNQNGAPKVNQWALECAILAQEVARLRGEITVLLRTGQRENGVEKKSARR